MSVAAATASAGIPRTSSLGPYKMQVFDVPLISGNTSVTVTADTMNLVLHAILCVGVTQTAAPSYSGNVATFTVTDPVATIKGQAIVFGI